MHKPEIIAIYVGNGLVRLIGHSISRKNPDMLCCILLTARLLGAFPREAGKY